MHRDFVLLLHGRVLLDENFRPFCLDQDAFFRPQICEESRAEGSARSKIRHVIVPLLQKSKSHIKPLRLCYGNEVINITIYT